jgi:hypothetical protein
MERLTARSPKNNMAYLVKVKPDEQEVESPYPNTLEAIIESFKRLAEYEDTGFNPEEITQLKKILQMADIVMRGAIKSIGLGIKDEQHYYWKEMQDICNMIYQLGIQ